MYYICVGTQTYDQWSVRISSSHAAVILSNVCVRWIIPQSFLLFCAFDDDCVIWILYESGINVVLHPLHYRKCLFWGAGAEVKGEHLLLFLFGIQKRAATQLMLSVWHSVELFHLRNHTNSTAAIERTHVHHLYIYIYRQFAVGVDWFYAWAWLEQSEQYKLRCLSLLIAIWTFCLY